MFFVVTPSFLSSNWDRKGDKCEGCESKKCKIADGGARTRTREGTFWSCHNPMVAINDDTFPYKRLHLRKHRPICGTLNEKYRRNDDMDERGTKSKGMPRL